MCLLSFLGRGGERWATAGGAQGLVWVCAQEGTLAVLRGPQVVLELNWGSRYTTFTSCTISPAPRALSLLEWAGTGEIQEVRHWPCMQSFWPDPGSFPGMVQGSLLSTDPGAGPEYLQVWTSLCQTWVSKVVLSGRRRGGLCFNGLCFPSPWQPPDLHRNREPGCPGSQSSPPPVERFV